MDGIKMVDINKAKPQEKQKKLSKKKIKELEKSGILLGLYYVDGMI